MLYDLTASFVFESVDDAVNASNYIESIINRDIQGNSFTPIQIQEPQEGYAPPSGYAINFVLKFATANERQVVKDYIFENISVLASCGKIEQHNCGHDENLPCEAVEALSRWGDIGGDLDV